MPGKTADHFVAVLLCAVLFSLPIVELDVFAFPRDWVQDVPLWATLCNLLLTPVTTACLFYATGFAPTANRKPWLAYLVVALVLLFPRACNAFNFDSLSIELILYLAQLPIHWAACWAYQKTDTIWARSSPYPVPICSTVLRRFSCFDKKELPQTREFSFYSGIIA